MSHTNLPFATYFKCISGVSYGLFYSLELVGSLGHVLLRIKLFTGFVLSIKNMVRLLTLMKIN